MKELLPRERFARAIRHEPVDRVPLLYRMKHEAKEKLARIYGIKDAATGRKHNPELELRLGNDAISFRARFGGIATEVYVPVDAVLAIYAKENGRGMVFSDDGDEPEPSETGKQANKRPSLKIVK